MRKDYFKDFFYVQLHTIAPHSDAHTDSLTGLSFKSRTVSLSVIVCGSNIIMLYEFFPSLWVFFRLSLTISLC